MYIKTGNDFITFVNNVLNLFPTFDKKYNSLHV